jgi:hypothetical protein
MAIFDLISPRRLPNAPENFDHSDFATPNSNRDKSRLTVIKGFAPISFVTPGKDASNVRESISTTRFIAIVATIVTINLLGILVINTKLDQDAFTLAHLKDQRSVAMDQRDYIMSIVDSENSPSFIAKKASSLGMFPNKNLSYISLNSPSVVHNAPQTRQAAISIK